MTLLAVLFIAIDKTLSGTVPAAKSEHVGTTFRGRGDNMAPKRPFLSKDDVKDLFQIILFKFYDAEEMVDRV